MLKINTTAANEWVRNKKTGTEALVVSRYIDTFSGKAKIEVALTGIMAKSHRAYWLASSCNDLHA